MFFYLLKSRGNMICRYYSEGPIGSVKNWLREMMIISRITSTMCGEGKCRCIHVTKPIQYKKKHSVIMLAKLMTIYKYCCITPKISTFGHDVEYIINFYKNIHINAFRNTVKSPPHPGQYCCK